MNLVIGANGLLGTALRERLHNAIGTSRRGMAELQFDLTDDPAVLPSCSVAYLCAGTKGFRECEGNEAAFRADVDGNIRIAKKLLKRGTFIVFVSAEGVIWASQYAYCRNRLLVEMALVMQPNVAIVRPAKFTKDNVASLAAFCAKVGGERLDGVHHWSAA